MQNVNLNNLSLPPKTNEKWGQNFKSSDFISKVSGKLKQFFFKSRSANDFQIDEINVDQI